MIRDFLKCQLFSLMEKIHPMHPNKICARMYIKKILGYHHDSDRKFDSLYYNARNNMLDQPRTNRRQWYTKNLQSHDNYSMRGAYNYRVCLTSACNPHVTFFSKTICLNAKLYTFSSFYIYPNTKTIWWVESLPK